MSSFVGEVSALSAAACWAVSSLLFAHAGRSTSALAINTYKCCLGLTLLGTAALVVDGPRAFLAFTGAEVAELAVSGVIGLALADTLYFAGLARVGPRIALLVWSMAAPLTAVLAVPLLGERPTMAVAVGTLLTVVGVVWVVSERAPGGGGQGRPSLAGVAFAGLGALGQAAATLLTKTGGGEHSAITIGALRMVAGVFGLLLHMAITGRGAELLHIVQTPTLRRTLTLATLIGTFLGIWLSSAGVRYAPAGIAATLGSTSPIFVLPLAALFLHERLSARSIVGALVAVLGIAAVFLGQGA